MTLFRIFETMSRLSSLRYTLYFPFNAILDIIYRIEYDYITAMLSWIYSRAVLENEQISSLDGTTFVEKVKPFSLFSGNICYWSTQ